MENDPFDRQREIFGAFKQLFEAADELITAKKSPPKVKQSNVYDLSPSSSFLLSDVSAITRDKNNAILILLKNGFEMRCDELGSQAAEAYQKLLAAWKAQL